MGTTHDHVLTTDVGSVAKHNVIPDFKKGGDVVEHAGVSVNDRIGLSSDRFNLVLKLLDTLQSIIKLLP